jgi:branched-chain amino acid transport system substrate-binding protein
MGKVSWQRALAILWAAAAAVGCEADEPGDMEAAAGLVIGANLELTGDLPEVGRSSRRAAELFVADRNGAGGLTLGEETLEWTLELRDNRDDVDAAAAAAAALSLETGVLALLGPNISTLAIPAGGIAEELETPMVSPWSTNPATTAGRDWVFRAAFVDTYQGPVLAEFATAQYSATTACVLYQSDDAYSSGIAAAFRDEWEVLHGDTSVLAYESFEGGETDFSAQLVLVRDSGCDVLFAPLFADEVIETVTQADTLGVAAPILGSDSWVSSGLLAACGALCDGIFFSAHYIATGATGVTRDFIDAYEAQYAEVPDDIAALTWDAMLVLEQGLVNCGDLTGDLLVDRACLRDGIAAIRGVEGVTGTIDYGITGDPQKCAVIGQIQGGEFVAVDEVCP